ncbi:MAG: hypothetical protein JST86_13570 [Bacteroidetes bacterium]|nr:hypothetical protein [Bacteroidota bacterium]
MNAKILLIAFSAVAFSSCVTTYKSGQTPDDVYYSPLRPADERKQDDIQRDRDEAQRNANAVEYNRIRMSIRDPRWRDLDDYDYSYNYSPYYYSYSSYNTYGYYYNPYYCSKPLYYIGATYSAPVNHTPRMVNLNTYRNYTTAISTNPKTGLSNSQTYYRQYNTSNNGNKVGSFLREVITPSASGRSGSSGSSSNSTRTYTPSSSGSSSGGSSSGGSSSGGSVSRPGRG